MSIQNNIQYATLAGGCFWCIVPPYDNVPGVLEVITGYSGGTLENPTYDDVCSGISGHFEVIRVTFDTSQLTYKTILELFLTNIDPTDQNGQFHDRGQQYQPAIFYHNETQKMEAEEVLNLLNDAKIFTRPISVSVMPATVFYPAEEYHQNYHKKNPVHYNLYKIGSGREKFTKSIWTKENKQKVFQNNSQFMKPSVDFESLHSLTPMQYHVTQENGTEPPFQNEFWDHKEPGIYVDILTGEPLFSSLDKFDSGCGWPSFTKPLQSSNLVEKQDVSHFMIRTEVRSKLGDCHLGHVFEDGPKPTGLRYCINSAALRFIHYEDLEDEGYGEFKQLFK